MAKQSNWSKSGNYSINDRVGGENMPVEGAEPLRSFADGTGKRKYDRDDPSVVIMRKRRAMQYQKHGVGVPGTGGFVLTTREMIERGILNKDGSPKKHANPSTFRIDRKTRKARRLQKTRDNLLTHIERQHQRELAEKMEQRHKQEREAQLARFKMRRAKERNDS